MREILAVVSGVSALIKSAKVAANSQHSDYFGEAQVARLAEVGELLFGLLSAKDSRASRSARSRRVDCLCTAVNACGAVRLRLHVARSGAGRRVRQVLVVRPRRIVHEGMRGPSRVGSGTCAPARGEVGAPVLEFADGILEPADGALRLADLGVAGADDILVRGSVAHGLETFEDLALLDDASLQRGEFGAEVGLRLSRRLPPREIGTQGSGQI